LYDRVEDELRAIPGVTSVTTALVPLMAGNNWGNSVSVEGFKKGPDTDASSRFNEIGVDYFKTVGAHRLAGREFTLADGIGAPKVAIINQAFARKFGLFGPHPSASEISGVIGKRMSQGSDSLDIEIVGLVQNAKYSEVKDTVPPVFYVPRRQDSNAGSMYFYVQSSLQPASILPMIPKLIRRLDPGLPVEDLKSMPQQVKDNVFLDRMISMLSAAFAILATVLAAIGLYGVLAYSVAQRTSEIGIRVALGADAWHVRLMVLRQVERMTLVGALIGIALAVGIGRGAGSLLYEIKGYDPIVFIASTLLLVAVSLAAGYFPALRASRIDPIQALRYE
jgi:predicted permease